MTTTTRVAFSLLTAIILAGTTYSVLQNTSLDTSNPLLTHLPHPLSKSHKFASKSNPLNVYFIKQAWAWTTAAFLLLWGTGTPSSRTVARLSRYLTATATWLVFTAWFFGPALFERIVLLSGGECLVPLPDGELLTLPAEYCHKRTTVSPMTHPDLFTSSLTSQTSFTDGWRGTPPPPSRPRRLGPHLPPHPLHPPPGTTTRPVPAPNALVLATHLVYFHSPGEKISGYVLGVACFAISQLPGSLLV
ncbi:hypothetical protein MKEN_00704400 [Mycena kentingensis (nom. inval.)]|nr:hypothetical protein MKEN_00704400 [Mycena kentingensis (nom. inval.)]